MEDNPTMRMISDLKARRQQRMSALGAKMQVEDLQRRMARASMRLAAVDPHLYNEIVAGRTLPRDAVVFGGKPRTDLMEDLSMSMAEGNFQEPQTAQSELLSQLGV